MNPTILITDLHFGNQNNNIQHNINLQEFGEYVAKHPHLAKVKDLYVLGDVFHQRDKLDVYTINAALAFFDLLSRRFDIKCIVGNHDMYYRDRRDVHSVKVLSPYVDIIEDYTRVGDHALTAWCTSGEEYDELVNKTKKDKVKALFGHFEFSNFKMNDHYVMEHGQTHKSLQHIPRVFTGHYHMRQVKDNVTYVGTPFPFDFNDANDTERGFALVMDEGQAFSNYDRVKVLSMTHKEFLCSTDKADDNTTIRVVIDEEIDQDAMDELKDKMESGGFRDARIQYKAPKDAELEAYDATDLVDAEDVADIDSLVKGMLSSMEDSNFDKDLLVGMYQKSIGD